MSGPERKVSGADNGKYGIDVRVLGLLIASQNVLFALPDETHIGDFFSETLVSIPGVTGCRICLGGVSVQKGEVDGEICGHCSAWQRTDTSKFQCSLENQPGIRIISLETDENFFGFLVMQTDDSGDFTIYEPFVNNLANLLTLFLENRLQKRLLQAARDNLELKVSERTEELDKKVEELKRFSKVSLGRELRIIELKDEIKRLKDELSKDDAA